MFVRLYRETGTLYGVSLAPRTPSRISFADAYAARCSDPDFGSRHADSDENETEGELSEDETAAQLGIARARVGQLQSSALATLRNRMEDATGERIGKGQRIRRQVMTCGRCGEAGHNRTSCPREKRKKGKQ